MNIDSTNDQSYYQTLLQTQRMWINVLCMLVVGLIGGLVQALVHKGSGSTTAIPVATANEAPADREPIGTAQLASLHRRSLETESKYKSTRELLFSAQADLQEAEKELSESIERLTKAKSDGRNSLATQRQTDKRLPLARAEYELAKIAFEKTYSNYLSVAQDVDLRIDQIEQEQIEAYQASMRRYIKIDEHADRWQNVRTGSTFITRKNPNTRSQEDAEGIPTGGTNPSLQIRVRVAIEPELSRRREAKLAFEQANANLQTLLAEGRELFRQKRIIKLQLESLTREVMTLNKTVPELKEKISKLNASLPKLEMDFERSKNDHLVASNLFENEQRRLGNPVHQPQHLASY